MFTGFTFNIYIYCMYHKYAYIHLASSIPTIRQLGSPNASSDLRPASGRAALRENLNCQLPGSSGENRFGYLESTLPPIMEVENRVIFGARVCFR